MPTLDVHVSSHPRCHVILRFGKARTKWKTHPQTLHPICSLRARPAGALRKAAAAARPGHRLLITDVGIHRNTHAVHSTRHPAVGFAHMNYGAPLQELHATTLMQHTYGDREPENLLSRASASTCRNVLITSIPQRTTQFSGIALVLLQWSADNLNGSSFATRGCRQN